MDVQLSVKSVGDKKYYEEGGGRHEKFVNNILKAFSYAPLPEERNRQLHMNPNRGRMQHIIRTDEKGKMIGGGRAACACANQRIQTNPYEVNTTSTE